MDLIYCKRQNPVSVTASAPRGIPRMRCRRGEMVEIIGCGRSVAVACRAGRGEACADDLQI